MQDPHTPRSAIDLDDKSPDYYVLLAKLLADAGQLAEAFAPLRQAIALDPGHLEAGVLLGSRAFDDGDYQECIERLDTVHHLVDVKYH